jgi:hypothetical protein
MAEAIKSGVNPRALAAEKLPQAFLEALENEDAARARDIVDVSYDKIIVGEFHPKVRGELADICVDFDVLRMLSIAGHQVIGTEWLDNRGEL